MNFNFVFSSQAPRIIRVDIKPSVTRCTTFAAATTNRNFARIQVNWMRIESADWKPGLEVYVETKVQTVQRVPATLFAEAIAAEHVNDVPAIAVQRPNGELITQQVQISCRKVKQRLMAGSVWPLSLRR